MSISSYGDPDQHNKSTLLLLIITIFLLFTILLLFSLFSGRQGVHSTSIRRITSREGELGELGPRADSYFCAFMFFMKNKNSKNVISIFLKSGHKFGRYFNNFEESSSSMDSRTYSNPSPPFLGISWLMHAVQLIFNEESTEWLRDWQFDLFWLKASIKTLPWSINTGL